MEGSQGKGISCAILTMRHAAQPRSQADACTSSYSGIQARAYTNARTHTRERARIHTGTGRQADGRTDAGRLTHMMGSDWSEARQDTGSTLRLECIVDAHDEGVLQLLHDVALRLRQLRFLALPGHPLSMSCDGCGTQRKRTSRGTWTTRSFLIAFMA